MNNRPLFTKNLSVEEFKKHYWYKTELEKICRKYELPSQGTKAELQSYIIDFLSGKEPSNKRATSSKIRKNKILTDGMITLDTKLIEDGFKFDNVARKFFAEYFNVEKFSFTKDMAVALRKAEEENDLEMTVRDLIKIYEERKNNNLKKSQNKKSSTVNQSIQNAEEKTYQWNNFVRDFFNDESISNYPKNMKAAAYLWRIVRDNPGLKMYSTELFIKYKDELDKL